MTVWCLQYEGYDVDIGNPHILIGIYATKELAEAEEARILEDPYDWKEKNKNKCGYYTLSGFYIEADDFSIWEEVVREC